MPKAQWLSCTQRTQYFVTNRKRSESASNTSHTEMLKVTEFNH